MQILRRGSVFVDWQALFRKRRLARNRRRQAIQYVFLRDDLQRQSRIGPSQFRNGGISAHMIRMHVRIDDVTHRTGRKFVNLGHQFRSQRRKLRIHQQHALVANLHRGVASRAHQHVDIVLHRLDVDFNFVEILLLAIGSRGAQRENGNTQYGGSHLSPFGRSRCGAETN